MIFLNIYFIYVIFFHNINHMTLARKYHNPIRDVELFLNSIIIHQHRKNQPVHI